MFLFDAMSLSGLGPLSLPSSLLVYLQLQYRIGGINTSLLFPLLMSLSPVAGCAGSEANKTLLNYMRANKQAQRRCALCNKFLCMSVTHKIESSS